MNRNASRKGIESGQVVIRTFATDAEGQRQLQAETTRLARLGYLPQTQSQEGGHIHVGRLLLSGGLSVLVGRSGTRSTGSITITFVETASRSPAPSEGAPETDAQLDEWRPRGGYFDPRTGLFAGEKPESAVTPTVPADSRAPEIATSKRAAASDLADALERLAALRAGGDLSEEEFRIAKGQLLEGAREEADAIGD